MVDDSETEPTSGPLNRQAFVRALRSTQETLPESKHRGCLLVFRFPILQKLAESQGEDALDDALGHLLAIIETRLRSRDTLGRISLNSVCVLLKQCRVSDAIVVADQYVSLLKDIVINVGGRQRALDIRYRVVPLDLVVNRAGQGASSLIRSADVSVAGSLQKQIQVSTNHVDLSQSKIVSLRDMRQPQLAAQSEPVRVVRVPDAAPMAQLPISSWRLKPGMLINRNCLVCCFRLQQVGQRAAPMTLQQSSVFTAVLRALSLDKSNTRPMVESQIILPVLLEQIDVGFPEWVAERCDQMRVAPSDICLSFNDRDLMIGLKDKSAVLRQLKRRGLKLMIEGVQSAMRFSTIQALVDIDYLYFSGRMLNDAIGQAQARQDLEELISVAGARHCEICSAGVDTPRLIKYAQALNIEIGFGKLCGRSLPFPATKGESRC